MRKIDEADLMNHVLSWLSEQMEMETFRLQHAYAVEFVAMGNGWCEFNLHLWDGSISYMEAYVERDQTMHVDIRLTSSFGRWE